MIQRHELEENVLPDRDVPSGVLHLFHLGVLKHLLKACIEKMTDLQIAKLESHLSSFDDQQKISHNICKHFNSRQGKDLKKMVRTCNYTLYWKLCKYVIINVTRLTKSNACRLNFHISYSFIDSDCSLQLCICRPWSKVYQDDMHSFFGKYCASMCKDKFNSYM